MKKKEKTISQSQIPYTCYSRPSRPPTKKEMSEYHIMCWKALIEAEEKKIKNMEV